MASSPGSGADCDNTSVSYPVGVSELTFDTDSVINHYATNATKPPAATHCTFDALCGISERFLDDSFQAGRHAFTGGVEPTNFHSTLSCRFFLGNSLQHLTKLSDKAFTVRNVHVPMRPHPDNTSEATGIKRSNFHFDRHDSVDRHGTSTNMWDADAAWHSAVVRAPPLPQLATTQPHSWPATCVPPPALLGHPMQVHPWPDSPLGSVALTRPGPDPDPTRTRPGPIMGHGTSATTQPHSWLATCVPPPTLLGHPMLSTPEPSRNGTFGSTTCSSRLVSSRLVSSRTCRAQEWQSP